jgi:hypothetical protein
MSITHPVVPFEIVAFRGELEGENIATARAAPTLTFVTMISPLFQVMYVAAGRSRWILKGGWVHALFSLSDRFGFQPSWSTSWI